MQRKLFWLAGWTPPDDPSSALCLTRRALDLPCPGCGLTRGIAQLAQGNLGEALTLHPLAPLVAVDLVAGWALWGLVAYGITAAPPARAVRAVLLAQLALFFALWLGRLASGTAPF